MSTQPKSKLHLTFSTTYRPPVRLELFSTSLQGGDERQLLDGVSYNYNGHVIPPAALRNILSRPVFHQKNIRLEHVDMSSGLLFVSERTGGLETLHVAFRVNGETKPRVFELGHIYGAERFGGIRMEDTGRIAGDDFLVYVSTKKPAPHRRMPWTAVYKTKLSTGCTWRLTPNGVADISPAVSPSGKKIAVASFEKKGGWNGEVEDLKTSIYVMDICFNDRYLVVENGGWPSWGSDNVLFFHRKVGDDWVVFRAEPDPQNQARLWRTIQVTPNGINTMTPVAIDANSVVAAVVRKKFDSKLSDDQREKEHYRHMEMFRVGPRPGQGIPITPKSKPLADHFNPFIIRDQCGGVRIGYHRCQDKLAQAGSSDKINSPLKDVEVRRVAGSFPTFSKDGTKLAFVDNEFKTVYLADSKGSVRKIYEGDQDSVFSPVWSKNPRDDTLFVCKGKSFKPKESVHIYAIENISTKPHFKQLTFGQSNNAFPTTNREGTQMVFRSTKDHGDKGFKNLYLMDNIKDGDYGSRKLTRLTQGPWKDTHCDWSPNNDWIVFSSTRAHPGTEHYAVYMLNIHHKDTVIRVAKSAENAFGFVNHPFFSPDGKTLVVTSDLAAVSADPISLPFFLHSVRPYGDVFTIEIDPQRMENNGDLRNFQRVTHSRYENALATWALIKQPAPRKGEAYGAYSQNMSSYNAGNWNMGSFNAGGGIPHHLRMGLAHNAGGPLNSWGPLDHALGAVDQALGVVEQAVDAIKDPIDMMLSAIPVAFQQGGAGCPFLRNGGQSSIMTGHIVVPSRGC